MDVNHTLVQGIATEFGDLREVWPAQPPANFPPQLPPPSAVAGGMQHVRDPLPNHSFGGPWSMVQQQMHQGGPLVAQHQHYLWSASPQTPANMSLTPSHTFNKPRPGRSNWNVENPSNIPTTGRTPQIDPQSRVALTGDDDEPSSIAMHRTPQSGVPSSRKRKESGVDEEPHPLGREVLGVSPKKISTPRKYPVAGERSLMDTPFGLQPVWQFDPETLPLEPPEASASTVPLTPDAHTGQAMGTAGALLDLIRDGKLSSCVDISPIFSAIARELSSSSSTNDIASFVTGQSAQNLAHIVAFAESLRRNGQAGAARELAAACLPSRHAQSGSALQARLLNLRAQPAT